MPYSIDWIVNDRVLAVTTRGILTEYELRSMLEDCARLSKKGTKPTYTIIDTLDLRRTSFGVDTFKRVSGIHVSHELIVVVANNASVITLVQAAAAIFGQKLIVTPTVDEAKLTITQHDPSIQFP